MQNILHALDIQLPRYTSYPTAPVWKALDSSAVYPFLEKARDTSQTLSLYIHIPFCKSMCLYCGCSVVLNRKKENEDRYVEYLKKEIELVSKHLVYPEKKKVVQQLHFGGGTPTQLNEEHFIDIFNVLNTYFSFSENAEIAIEVDPRTVYEDNGKKLNVLHSIGFNRISFGVQDTNEQVQAAVKRYQSFEMTKTTFLKAQKLGFQETNIDLIYGLPLQTLDTFKETIDKIIQLSPDRIALFSYAKVPHLKPHQKAIKEDLLPSRDEKFAIYTYAREALIHAGYVAIGMDHFAKSTSQLVHARKNGTLYRNFQGYTVFEAKDLIPFGMTAIGYMQGIYFQNAKTLDSYYADLDQDILPVKRGILLSSDDMVRRFVIQEIMCHAQLLYQSFYAKFGQHFWDYFGKREQEKLDMFKEQQLLIETTDGLFATETGALFLRNIASCFDIYLDTMKGGFSQSI